MAYTELIKHFERIREYMHEFYIYGFRSRNYIQKKSQRSYDNEKRRLESYLTNYMSFQYLNSKLVFLSIDNRHLPHNPLYKAFESKSFTDKSITLHFLLLDILYHPSIQLSLKEIIQQIDEYLFYFNNPIYFDESTIRKKVNEYVKLGIIQIIKVNHQNIYQRSCDFHLKPYEDALLFFSEASILGIPGHYLLNRFDHHDYFRFKHHYVAYAIDSEIIYSLFTAIKQKRHIIINTHNPRKHKDNSSYVVPLKIYMSSQTGRSHLLAYSHRYQTIKTFRIDYIHKVVLQDICPSFDTYRDKLNKNQKHIWSIQYLPYHLEHVEFVLVILPYENYIYQRLVREKRVGLITKIDDTHYCFQADVYDTNELMPWMRTFICRITELHFSNRSVENRLRNDINMMYQMYEIGDDV